MTNRIIIEVTPEGEVRVQGRMNFKTKGEMAMATLHLERFVEEMKNSVIGKDIVVASREGEQ